MADLDDIRSDDPLKQQEAMRDYIINELSDNRCKSCNSSRLRTGDQASLLLRLQKILEEILEIKRSRAIAARAANLPEGVTSLASIRKRSPSDGDTDSETSREAGIGTKAGPRRQGGRKPRTGSD